MSALRKQMQADMVLRGLAYRTQQTYIEAVAKFAKFYGRSPDQISEAEAQSYVLYLLRERKLAHSSCNVVASALEFLYRNTLKRREAEFDLPRPKMPQRLPQILSREEVAALFEHAANLKHRVFLMTTYAAGLRLLEACHLKVSDIDSDRMTIRVEQGKGAKDRYTLLSPGLLKELRRYWIAQRPKRWLFPSPRNAEAATVLAGFDCAARGQYSSPMKVSEALRMLNNDGWYLVATRGSHRQFKHLTKPGRVTVPGKPSDDLAPGTLNSILKQAGLKR